jgi:hypothetical protein
MKTAKFWIVYLRLMQDKINLQNKDEIKKDIVDLFKSSPDFQLIISELGDLLGIECSPFESE